MQGRLQRKAQACCPPQTAASGVTMTRCYIRLSDLRLCVYSLYCVVCSVRRTTVRRVRRTCLLLSQNTKLY